MSEFMIVPFSVVAEVYEYATLYNNLNNRSTLDHNETIDSEKMVEAFHEHGFIRDEKSTFLIKNQDGDIAGTIGFEKKSNFEFVIGYRLMRLEDMGKGLMTKVLKKYVSDVFSLYPNINRLTLMIHSENVPSKKVALKCGFVYEGSMRDGYMYRGKVVDFEIYSLLRREYY